jgi:hypothetical protein
MVFPVWLVDTIDSKRVRSKAVEEGGIQRVLMVEKIDQHSVHTWKRRERQSPRNISVQLTKEMIDVTPRIARQHHMSFTPVLIILRLVQMLVDTTETSFNTVEDQSEGSLAICYILLLPRNTTSGGHSECVFLFVIWCRSNRSRSRSSRSRSSSRCRSRSSIGSWSRCRGYRTVTLRQNLCTHSMHLSQLRETLLAPPVVSSQVIREHCKGGIQVGAHRCKCLATGSELILLPIRFA